MATVDVGASATPFRTPTYESGIQGSSLQVGQTTLESKGLNDIFVLKLDAEGNVLWAVQGGGIGGDTLRALALDPAGDIYLTGECEVGGRFGEHIVGNSSGYLAKLERSGRFSWAFPLATVDEADLLAGANSPRALAVASVGEILVAGEFAGKVQMGPHSLVSAGKSDLFVAKVRER